jgi:hypothetical protein
MLAALDSDDYDTRTMVASCFVCHGFDVDAVGPVLRKLSQVRRWFRMWAETWTGLSASGGTDSP